MKAMAPRTASAAFECGVRSAGVARPAIAVQPALLYVLAASFGGLGAGAIIAGALAVLFLYTAAVAYNDLNDVAVDRLNSRDLALATGRADSADAHRLIVMSLAVVGLAQLWLAQPVGLLVCITAIWGAFLYSNSVISLQSRGIVGPLVLGILYVGGPMTLALAQGTMQYSGIVPGIIGLSLLAAGTLVYSDIPDEPGDARGGKRTVVVRHGAAKARWIAATVMVLGSTVSVASLRPGTILVSGFAACFAVLTARTNGDPSMLRITRHLTLAALIVGAATL